ncbi:MAG: nucleoside triphosphate pyrophosphohydrolase [Candidatus Thorarchaeota archaeon]
MVKEKLVRDRIPELIRNSGEEPVVRKANQQELEKFLLAKIVEEAQEFLETGDVDELVDILEVLEAFMEYRKIDSGLIEIQQHAKRLARGGFTEGLILQTDE